MLRTAPQTYAPLTVEIEWRSLRTGRVARRVLNCGHVPSPLPASVHEGAYLKEIGILNIGMRGQVLSVRRTANAAN